MARSATRSHSLRSGPAFVADTGAAELPTARNTIDPSATTASAAQRDLRMICFSCRETRASRTRLACKPGAGLRPHAEAHRSPDAPREGRDENGQRVASAGERVNSAGYCKTTRAGGKERFTQLPPW